MNTTPNPPHLSHKEKEVLTLIADGHSSRAIATRLCLSIDTIHSHRKNMIRKAGMRSILPVVLLAVRHQIITPRYA